MFGCPLLVLRLPRSTQKPIPWSGDSLEGLAWADLFATAQVRSGLREVAFRGCKHLTKRGNPRAQVFTDAVVGSQAGSIVTGFVLIWQ
jgi:hypothetical protein